MQPRTFTVESNGLITTGPSACAGYIFNFDSHGAFDPAGHLGDLTQDQIDRHNALLSQAEMESMLKHGSGTLYLSKDDQGCYYLSQWAGQTKIRVQAGGMKRSFHNFAGRDGRTDVWFGLDGSTWHGVNIGNSQICRVRRTKT